jgi:hypothetical protein
VGRMSALPPKRTFFDMSRMSAKPKNGHGNFLPWVFC